MNPVTDSHLTKAKKSADICWMDNSFPLQHSEASLKKISKISNYFDGISQLVIKPSNWVSV